VAWDWRKERRKEDGGRSTAWRRSADANKRQVPRCGFVGGARAMVGEDDDDCGDGGDVS